MKFFFITTIFLFKAYSCISQIKDTSIEILGDKIEGGSNFKTEENVGFNAFGVSNFVGVMDTSLQIDYFHSMVEYNLEIGIKPSGSIISLNIQDFKLGLKNQSNNYDSWSKNALKRPFNGYYSFQNSFIVTPSYNSRDSVNNLYIQKINFTDSLIKCYSIANSQGYGFCYLGAEKNGKIPYLLTAKDTLNPWYEFGFFDSTFNKSDTLRFKHPTTIPSLNNKYYAEAIYLKKSNKLLVAGISKIGTSAVVKAAPYKFTVNIQTKKIENIWYNIAPKLTSNYFVFFPKPQFDQWGNLFFTGRADTKEISWRRQYGILQMVDTNNYLLVDTLFQYNPNTNNETDFIYHLPSGNVILGGNYDYNTSISPAVWYMKFKLKNWYLPTVSIQEQTIKNNFSIYPNPFNSNLMIEGDLNKINSLKLFNFSGSLISNLNKTKNINLSELDNGIYFLEIEIEKDKIERHKIIKVKNK